MEEIRGLCAGHRLRAFHSHDSRRDWGPGFPDLVIAGAGGVLLREAKSETGTLSPAQAAWKWALQAAGLNWGLWRPSDLRTERIRAQLEAIAAPRTSPSRVS